MRRCFRAGNRDGPGQRSKPVLGCSKICYTGGHVMRLDEARGMIGQGVVYRGNYPDAKAEQGVITSVNSMYVFVRFDPMAPNGIACTAELLEPLTPKPEQRKQQAVAVMEALDRQQRIRGNTAEVTAVDDMIRTMREGEPPRDETAVTPTLAETMVWRVQPRGRPVEAMKVTATNLYPVLRWAGLHPGDGDADSEWVGCWVIRDNDQALLLTEFEFDTRYQLTGQVGHYVDTTGTYGV